MIKRIVRKGQKGTIINNIIMPVTIHATETVLYKIFSKDFSFTIPHYQRPYAWTIDQVGELYSDLMVYLEEDNKEIDEINPYFLGSIVLIKSAESPDADIVDGQQRLTTLTIMLSAIRLLASEQYSKEITTYLYEKGSVVIDTPNHYRLKLRERDEEFFRKYIQDESGFKQLLELDPSPLTDSRKNIRINAQYLYEKYKELDQRQLERYAKYLMKRCFLVVVSTPDLDSAYRIFTVLNARGLDLGLTDLLKSEIIGAIPREQQEKYTKIWESEEEDLGRALFQELFAHIRMIVRKAKAKETALNEFRKYIEPQKNPQKFIDEFLKPYSDSLEIIKSCDHKSTADAETTNLMLRLLNQIDNFD